MAERMITPALARLAAEESKAKGIQPAGTQPAGIQPTRAQTKGNSPSKAPKSDAPYRPTPFVERAMFLLAAMASIAAWGVMTARIMNDWHPIMDLASHLSWHVWIGLSVILVFSLLGIRFRTGEQRLRWWHRWIMALPPWVYFTWVTLPWQMLPIASNEPDAKGLKILSWNIWLENRAIDQVLKLIEEQDPDVICILELGPEQAKAMRKLESKYPHFLWLPDDTSRGIGLLSRVPATETRSLDLADQGMPAIEAKIPAGENHQAMRLMAVHTRSPGLQRRTVMRNTQLQSLAEWAALPADPAVIVGDLNTTPWAPTFRRLLNRGNLTDTREYRGYFSSWPYDFGNLGIPIDHGLVSKSIETKYRGVSAFAADSDHRAIMMVLR